MVSVLGHQGFGRSSDKNGFSVISRGMVAPVIKARPGSNVEIFMERNNPIEQTKKLF